MKCSRILLASLVVLVANPASADRLTRHNFDRYLGGGLWGLSYAPDTGRDYSMVGGMLRAGYELSPNLAIEAHFGLTDKDTQNAFAGLVPVELRVTALGGVFGKFSWVHSGPRDGWARLYGLLGASVVDVEAKGQGQSANDTETGVSFGVGIDLFGSDRTAIVLEWIRYIEDSDFDIEAAGVGVLYRF